MTLQAWTASAPASIAAPVIPGPAILPVTGQSPGAGPATAAMRRA